MTQEQNEQIIKVLEKRKELLKGEDTINGTWQIDIGEIKGLDFTLQLLNQTTVNRSSTEPKFIEE